MVWQQAFILQPFECIQHFEVLLGCAKHIICSNPDLGNMKDVQIVSH